jgi:hypothetical protein
MVSFADVVVDSEADALTRTTTTLPFVTEAGLAVNAAPFTEYSPPCTWIGESTPNCRPPTVIGFDADPASLDSRPGSA